MEKIYRFVVTCPAGPGPGEGDLLRQMSGISPGLVWGDHDQALVELVEPDETYHSSRSARRFMSVAFSDPAHYCKNIPCDYCGRDWPQASPADEFEAQDQLDLYKIYFSEVDTQ